MLEELLRANDEPSRIKRGIYMGVYSLEEMVTWSAVYLICGLNAFRAPTETTDIRHRRSLDGG